MLTAHAMDVENAFLFAYPCTLRRLVSLCIDHGAGISLRLDQGSEAVEGLQPDSGPGLVPCPGSLEAPILG